MLPVETYKISNHAAVRILERTSLSIGQLLDRLSANGVAWLPAKLPEGHRHALIYCARSERFLVAVIHEADRVVKTIVTLEQWENMYRKVANVWMSLAIHAAAQGLLSNVKESGTLLTTPGEASRIGGPESVDMRLVAKFDGPKGPAYHDLLSLREFQWTEMMGSSPAKRRFQKSDFLGHLANRLLTVGTIAELVRQRLIRHTALVMEASNLLLVFGPSSCPASLLPQVDVGQQLADMVAQIETALQKRKEAKARLTQRRHAAFLERQALAHEAQYLSQASSKSFELSVESPSDKPSSI